MKKMNTTTLSNLVKKEASKLRKNATRKELSCLNFRYLSPSNSKFCIYGQVAGSCFSRRANKLIKSCAEKVYVGPLGVPNLCTPNGKMKLGKDGHRIGGDQWSPIELFIGFEENRLNGNNEALVNYLKGETKKLTFKKF